ncbi:hypothetical protein M885DRAFT_578753 [Pelagophyceae sp. CCMP2097]|nr:hypothetical protein M885DRAFT_578753 [Pelagophyceae sp. CCMP2097]
MSHGSVLMKGEGTERRLVGADPTRPLPKLLERFWEDKQGSFKAYEAPSLLGDIGARAICLPRLNVLARALSAVTKVGGVEHSDTKAQFDCAAHRFKTEFLRIDRFYDDNAGLGDSTHVLWLPYEADVRDLTASTTQFAPHEASRSFREPEKCEAEINKAYGEACAKRVVDQLYNPTFPFGRRTTWES